MTIEGVKQVYQVEDDSLGYEWSELHIYVHPREPRRFAVLSDSGCSCYMYDADLAAAEGAQPKTMTEARAELSAWMIDNGFKSDSIARELERATLNMRAKKETR